MLLGIVTYVMTGAPLLGAPSTVKQIRGAPMRIWMLSADFFVSGDVDPAARLATPTALHEQGRVLQGEAAPNTQAV
jgi:hypothetical protein